MGKVVLVYKIISSSFSPKTCSRHLSGDAFSPFVSRPQAKTKPTSKRQAMRISGV